MTWRTGVVPTKNITARVKALRRIIRPTDVGLNEVLDGSDRAEAVAFHQAAAGPVGTGGHAGNRRAPTLRRVAQKQASKGIRCARAPMRAGDQEAVDIALILVDPHQSVAYQLSLIA